MTSETKAILRQEKAQARRRQLEQAILDWLGQQYRAQHALAVAQAVGLRSDQAAQRILRSMEARGLLGSARLGLGGRTHFHVIKKD